MPLKNDQFSLEILYILAVFEEFHYILYIYLRMQIFFVEMHNSEVISNINL